MTTPPTIQPPGVTHSGPAWTRNPKSSPKKNKARQTPYAAGAASSTSSISLLNPQASTSSLSLPQATQHQQQNEAPYLTHRHRYHGQLTLVAPDNLGTRRQAGTVDAPETRVDARGGFGLPGMEERASGGDNEGEEEDDERGSKIKKKVRKKKKKEEEEARQRQIVQAVSNAGRTPSPTSAPRREQGQRAGGIAVGGSNEMTRSSSGQGRLTVPPHETQARRRRSKSRSRTAARNETRTMESRPATAQSLTQPENQPENLDLSRHTPSSRPTPVSSSDISASSHRRSLSPSYLPPPALDDPSLESQISLGLIDPSVLLSPPPPAYDPPQSSSAPFLPREPPPPINIPSASPSSQQANLSRALSAASTINSEDEEDAEEEEEDSDSGPPDPLVVAWEEDRLTGLYSLDERIARDMERRRAVEVTSIADHMDGVIGSTGVDGSPVEEEEVAGQGEDDLNEIRQAEASRDSRRLSRALSRHASRRYGTGSGRSNPLLGSTTGLSELRENREVEESEPSAAQTHSPTTCFTLSGAATSHVPVSIPAIAPIVKLSSTTSHTSPRLEQSPRSPGTIGHVKQPVPPPLMSSAESSAIAAEFPSPSPSQASPSLSRSPSLSQADDEPEFPTTVTAPRPRDSQAGREGTTTLNASESEETEEGEEVEAPARRVTSNGRGLAALAAERRLRLEREYRAEPTTVRDSETSGGDAIEEPLRLEEEERRIAAAPSTRMDPTPENRPRSPSRRSREPTLPDWELSFSRASSRSSLPRPAAQPQLVPIQPGPTPPASLPLRTASVATNRPLPPPVPPRRSTGSRRVEASPPSPSASTSPPISDLPTRNRRVPPPPPPHRLSVRPLFGTNNTPSTVSTDASSPPSSSNQRQAVETVSLNSTSSPPSTLLGSRLVHVPGSPPTQSSMGSLDLSTSGSTPRPSAVDQPVPRRPRPLPIPPVPLSQNRIDAFTALRAVQGALSPASDSPGALSLNPSNVQATLSTSIATSIRPESSARPALHARLSTSSSSSLENPGPPLPRRPPQPRSEQLSAYTDLDLLLARLDGDLPVAGDAQDRAGDGTRVAGEDGRNYDDLLTLGEIMGNVAPAGASAEEIAEHLTVAPVELERRRIDKRGKVKTKLSVVGVRCVDCSICMSRFRVDDSAVVLSNCLHVFHEKCIRSWFRCSRQCPVCRAPAFPPRPLVDLTAP